MIAAVLKEPGKIELLDYPLRNLNAGELLVKVNCCGVCGTDRHIFEGKAPARIPVIPGHEYSGIVADKASNTGKFNVGDKIAVNPNIHCGYCKYCQSGRVNYCENLRALGVTLDGGFAEYSIVPQSQAYKLPGDFELNHAAFAEPLSCCLRGVDQAEIQHGENVIIIGGGGIGLIMLQLVKLGGASKIILIEPVEEKQKQGLKLGADYVLSPFDENLISIVNDTTNNDINTIIECVGKTDSVNLAVTLSTKGTKLVIFGLAAKNENIEINLQTIFQKELVIKNSLLNPFTFERAVDLIVSEKVVFENLISSRIKLGEINQIFNGDVNLQLIKTLVIN